CSTLAAPPTPPYLHLSLHDALPISGSDPVRRSPTTVSWAPAARARAALAGSWTKPRTWCPRAARAGTTWPANLPVEPRARIFMVSLLVLWSRHDQRVGGSWRER